MLTNRIKEEKWKLRREKGERQRGGEALVCLLSLPDYIKLPMSFKTEVDSSDRKKIMKGEA